MPDLSFIQPTKRRKMTKARAARIFLREQGRCYLCDRKLRPAAEKYEIEHPNPLALGGSDDDADLRVVCIPCHRAKSKTDAGEKAKRDRIVTQGWTGAKRSSFQNSRNGKYKTKIGGRTVLR